MKELKVHIWQVLLWEFKSKKNRSETVKKFSSVYDHDIIADYQVENWFSKFRSGETSFRDEFRPGHLSDLDLDVLREFMECNPRKRTRELSLDLNTS